MSDAAPPLLAVTLGDVAGVGPEIVAKALAAPGVRTRHRLAVFGPFKPLRRQAERHAPGLVLERVVSAEELAGWDFAASTPVVDDRSVIVPCAKRILGTVNAEAGRASHAAVLAAADACLAGQVEAMVTAPIHKAAWAAAGTGHPGHTEVLAERTGTNRVVMMLAGPRLKVTLATIHLPLRCVPEAITRDRLRMVIEVTAESLPLFGISRPRVAVAGLNPHAGDEGLFGDEEITTIAPAIAGARASGIDAQGPFPADTVFARAASGAFDAVVALYHDQGLGPIKTLDFERTVNISLGLPIIRTSVDHGTAFDIAGQGVANPSSLIEAIGWAGTMVLGRRARAG